MIQPLHWLAGNTNLLAGSGWCARSMGRALDRLRVKVILIKESPQLIIDESIMMNMFSTLLYFTLFKECLEFMYTKRRMSVVAQQSGAKVMHMHMARAELFNPRSQTNIKSTTCVAELGTVAVDAPLKELHNEKKQAICISLFQSHNSCGSAAPNITIRQHLG